MQIRSASLRALLLFFGVASMAAAATTAATTVPRRPVIVPAPRIATVADGAFPLTAETRIVTDGSDAVQSVASLLAERLRTATGFPLPVQSPRASSAADNTIVLRLGGSDPALGHEGYALEVTPRRVTITAPGHSGLLYGTQTLRQMLPPQVESRTKAAGVAWDIPAGRVYDYPRYPWRGLLVDSSRHIQSVPFLLRTLDLMAYHKMNVFHWHITDDPGWRMESKKYPRLTQVGAWRTERNGDRYGGFYTQDEIRKVVRYAAERGITVVPEIEMPGHSAGALAAYPFLACKPGNYEVYRVSEGIASVCPGKESTYRFFQEVLDETMTLFPSKIIHIGGDEVDKRPWRECPDCQATIRQHNLADEDALQHHFIKRMAEYLESKGRRLMGWNEIMQGGPLPKGVVMQQWVDPQSGAVAARAGNDVVISPTAWAYFDYSYDTIPLRKVYEAEPTPAGLTPEERKRVLGPQGNLWTETRPTDASVDDYTWPRLIALAEVGWSAPERRDWDDFQSRMRTAHYDRLALRGLGDLALTGDALKARLLAHSVFNAGKPVGTWTPQTVSEAFKDMEWDITPHIAGPGPYEVRMAYDAGASGLQLKGAWLLEDGREVASDIHDGFTGHRAESNRFRLPLEAYKPGARYTVRVRARADAGTDSHGRLWLVAED